MAKQFIEELDDLITRHRDDGKDVEEIISDLEVTIIVLKEVIDG